ncbi:hypothetical protein FRX31_004235 [Thalictrum thalictroides]|uniref:Uncharacterized protein n=1 Tax=Thalictrum thalictroides TaxID=46969 RepID=A0A7J6XB78_THATH|nr:hypothetical protein FRX31_004235 [Thalictrum thalictroides]
MAVSSKRQARPWTSFKAASPYTVGSPSSMILAMGRYSASGSQLCEIDITTEFNFAVEVSFSSI